MLFALLSRAAVGAATFDVYLDTHEWATISACTSAEYKLADRPDRCGYQNAECSYNGKPRVSCKFRRKGHSTWRDLDDRPSFKIKKMKTSTDDDYVFGTYACGTDVTCTALPASTLHNATTNVWQSSKATFNNRVENGAEVDAYKVFRDIGVVSPLAQDVVIRLFRNEKLAVGPYTYTMLEAFDDNFMEKYIDKTNYALWEIETTYSADRTVFAEYKRSKGSYKDLYEDGAVDCDDCNDCTAVCSPPYLASLNLQNYSEQAIQKYWAGELITGHWDGPCSFSPKNVYVAKAGDGNEYLVPHGLDQTFNQQCVHTKGVPTCAVLERCYADPACKSRAIAEIEVARTVAHKHDVSTCEEPMALIGVVGVTTIMGLFVWYAYGGVGTHVQMCATFFAFLMWAFIFGSGTVDYGMIKLSARTFEEYKGVWFANGLNGFDCAAHGEYCNFKGHCFGMRIAFVVGLAATIIALLSIDAHKVYTGASLLAAAAFAALIGIPARQDDTDLCAHNIDVSMSEGVIFAIVGLIAMLISTFYVCCRSTYMRVYSPEQKIAFSVEY